ncbi:unnamed protein product, partial [Prorocentrum cordatum]
VDTLFDVIVQVHARMGAKQAVSLVESLERLSAEGITVGTVCSGSDMPLCVPQKLCDFWEANFNIRPAIAHAFSCDISPMAQQFILRHHAPRYLFGDIAEMGKDMAFDVRSQELKPVQRVTVLIGGTECDNFSGLNFSTRAGEDGCAASGSGKSGTTLKGYMGYVERHLPLLALWENSDKTKAVDIEYMCQFLARLNYVVTWEKVDASDFSPQSRTRIYLIAWHSRHLAHLRELRTKDLTAEERGQIAAESWLPSVFQQLHSFAGIGGKLESFLLPDSHEEVREWRAHRMQTKTEAADKKGSAKAGADQKYEDEHLELFSAAGLKWPPNYKDAGLEDVVAHLPRRFAECVMYRDSRIELKKESSERIIDLNSRLDWQRVGPPVPCLVCTGRPWLVKRQRDLTGAEAMNLQGYMYQDLMFGPTFRMSNAELFHVAGNAMSGFILAPLFASLFSKATLWFDGFTRGLGDTVDAPDSDVDIDGDVVISSGSERDEGADLDEESDLPAVSDSGSEGPEI